MDENAERRLEERLDKGLGELRDALIRIEAKLDTKAHAADLKTMEERHRALELDFAGFKSKVSLLGMIGFAGLIPAIGIVYSVLHRLGL